MVKKLILTGLIVSSLGIAQTSGDYDIQKSVIASGGGNSEGGDFILNGSIDQYDANTTSTGGDFALNGGFWMAKPPINQTETIIANGFEY